jgi:hypothetical protein
MEEDAKFGVRWLQEIHNKLYEKGLKGQGLDSELWLPRIKDFNDVK